MTTPALAFERGNAEQAPGRLWSAPRLRAHVLVGCALATIPVAGCTDLLPFTDSGATENAEAAAPPDGRSFSSMAEQAVALQRQNRAMADEIRELEHKNNDLRSEVSKLRARLDREQAWGRTLTRIETFALQGPAIYVDNAHAMVTDRIYCTGSMEPTLGCGDVVIGYKPGQTELGVGDIVSYTVPDEFKSRCRSEGTTAILHRIVRVQSEPGGVYYYLRGDANAADDACGIPFSYVNYKVLAVALDSKIGTTTNEGG